MIVKLSKDEAEGFRKVKTITSKTQASKSDTLHISKQDETSIVKVQGYKALTLNQLQDIIKDIMYSKREFDSKNASSGLLRETLEQYLYTYLTNKYGLKVLFCLIQNLVVSWATTIIGMIGAHSKTDSIVLLFGKILRNEIEEEFFFEQEKTIETIRRLLESYLRSKNPLKATAELKKMKHELADGLISRVQAQEMV